MKNKYILYLKSLLLPIYFFFKKKINGINNTIIKKSFRIKLNVRINGNNNYIEFASECVLGEISLFVNGNNNKIIVSENCVIKSGIFWIEDDECEIFIGNNTTIESVDFGVTENKSKIYIGADCMLSAGIKFKTGDSHSILDSEKKMRLNPAGDIHIGNHVWIGQDAIILKNTQISDNCVIGIRSLVTKKFEDGLLIAGIPARVVKEKINWTRERI